MEHGNFLPLVEVLVTHFRPHIPLVLGGFLLLAMVVVEMAVAQFTHLKPPLILVTVEAVEQTMQVRHPVVLLAVLVLSSYVTHKI